MTDKINSSSIDFNLCEILYKLSAILETFPNESLQSEVTDVLNSIRQKKLQVAVVGEFRRGKSTLINALLGMSILPVEIEPTTAAINRITYGLKPKAIIHYKNGRSEEVPINKLSDYVTQLTPSSQMTAQTVREAEVQYPTELCGNHIDIIDTPGLNDTESMTAITEQMLDNINVAIMAVNATLPYSNAESYWSARLLSLPRLQHIVIVLTCMDLVPKRQREEIVAYVRSRIREKTLAVVRKNYPDKKEIIEKAERIFSEKDFMLYPVSAILALDSFDNGDFELLEQSGIPLLKKELVTIMNRQLQMKSVYDTERIVTKFSSFFSSLPIEMCTAPMEKQQEDIRCVKKAIHTYYGQRSDLISKALFDMNAELSKLLSSWLSEDNIETQIRKVFIKNLGAVTENTTEAILRAINNAESDITSYVLPSLKDSLQKAVNAAIIRGVNTFLALRDDILQYDKNAALLTNYGFSAASALRAQTVQSLQNGCSCDLPFFSLTLPRILLNQNIIQTVISPYIGVFSKKYRKAWQSALPEYSQKWISIVIQHEPPELSEKADSLIHADLGALNEKIKLLHESYEKAAAVINEGAAAIQKIKELTA